MTTLDLQGFCYDQRDGLLPILHSALTDSGGWITHRRTTSPTTVEFSLELQLAAIQELYASLVAAGIQLTRSTHATLTDLCTCRRHLAAGATLLSLRLELSFLDDLTLHSLLLAAAATA